MTPAKDQMVECIRAEMDAQGVTQAELARRIGRTPKHVNKVINGSAGAMDLDYWLFVLGHQYLVQTQPITHHPKEPT